MRASSFHLLYFYKRKCNIFPTTHRAYRLYFARLLRSSRRAPLVVVTGFIASTTAGQISLWAAMAPITLLRFWAAALNALTIEICTHVDGVLSADPKHVPAAFTLPRIWHAGGTEASTFRRQGASFRCHCSGSFRTIPILNDKIFRPHQPGTLIAPAATTAARR